MELSLSSPAEDSFKKPIEKDDLVLWVQSGNFYEHGKVTDVRFKYKGFRRIPEHQVRVMYKGGEKQSGWIPIRRILKLPLHPAKE